MHEMRTIAENIQAIRARHRQIVGAGDVDAEAAAELSKLEAQISRFDDMCLRHHRLNLCQAGFVYGQVLRHPADAHAGVAVGLGDRVRIVEGPDARDDEMSIVEATTIMGRRLGRGLAFRDWHADGRSLGVREEALFLKRSGNVPAASAPAAEAMAPQNAERPSETQKPPSETPARPAQARARRGRQDDLTPDLFG